MQQIVSFFWQMCLLRESPARLPSTPFTLGLIVACYLVIALVAVNVTRPSQTVPAVIGIVLTGMGVQAVLTYGLLAFKRIGSRFLATWSSLLGTNTIMLLILLPINLTLMNTEHETLTMFIDSVSWICLGWWLAIAGYILHKAADISILQGSALAFVMELLGVIVSVSLFPAS